MMRPQFRRSPSPLGAILRRLRAGKAMSQTILAAEAGISTRHLGFIELGRSQAGVEVVAALARALDAAPLDAELLFLAAGHAPPGARAQNLAWSGAVIDALPIAIFVLDRSHRVTLVNDAHVRLMGAPAAEAILGKDLRTDQIWGVPEARRAIEECLATGVSRAFEISATTRYGRTFAAEGRIGPLFADKGRVMGVQVVMHETSCEYPPGRAPSVILRDRAFARHASWPAG